MLDFTNSSFYPELAPKEEDIELVKQKLLHSKTAKLTSYHVKVFDMSKEDDIKEYEKLMPTIFNDVCAKTCVIWSKDRQFVNGTWKIYMEWSNYSVEKQNEE